MVVDNLLMCLLENVFSSHVLFEKVKYGMADGGNWMASIHGGSVVNFKDLIAHANKTLMISTVLLDIKKTRRSHARGQHTHHAHAPRTRNRTSVDLLRNSSLAPLPWS